MQDRCEGPPDVLYRGGGEVLVVDRIGAEHDEGDDMLAALWIGSADRGSLGDGAVLQQRGLDLRRSDATAGYLDG